MASVPAVSGAINVASLNGNEIVAIATAGPQSAQTTTGAIAALASLDTSNKIITLINTVGAGTLTPIALLGGNINRTGVQVGAFTDTTATAAQIIAALPAGAAIGASFKVTIANNQTAATGYVETVTGGTGVTVSGITAIPTGAAATYLVTYSAANTVTMVGTVADQTNTTELALAGSSSGQTIIKPSATASGVLTLPGATGTLAVAGGINTVSGAVCSSPFSQASNTTLTNVPGMVVNVASGGVYVFEIYLATTNNGTGGIKLNLSGGTATVSNFLADTFVYSTTTLEAEANQTTFASNLYAGAVAATVVLAKGIIAVNAGGTIQLQAAQDVSNATALTISQGSYITVTQIA